MRINDLLDINETMAKEYMSTFEYPWEALEGIGDLIKALGADLRRDEYIEHDNQVWVHKTAKIAPSAFISGPCIIGANTEVRHCAFIRGNALVGENCVVGNSTELKNVILFNNVQVPHYNYVGDSILGHYAHMGAGSITSNVKSDKTNVSIKDKETIIDTKRKKVGAIIGDHVEVGCNSVLNPGTVLGRSASVYPLTSVRGVIAENAIVKSMNDIVIKEK